MTEHKGSCHCGQIRLLLREDPSEASERDCSICRRTAGLWHYCPLDAVSVKGDAISYQQGDRALDLWHCPTCGCTTHWTATDPAYQRMGLNIRMFKPSLWCDLPRRMIHGASY